jgi:hypothetical protein
MALAASVWVKLAVPALFDEVFDVFPVFLPLLIIPKPSVFPILGVVTAGVVGEQV